jgi:UDP-glucose 4-epimerase
MKILITGIAGLLGSNLAKYIITNTEHQVVGIDNLSCGLEANVPAIRWYKVDAGNCSEIFKYEKPDVVYHFAAYAAECLSPFIRGYNYQNNLVVTSKIVTECIKNNVKRLVFTSSMAVYGQGDPPFSEENTCKPFDPYGVAKYACELDIQIAGVQHGLDWCILRPHNVYGPGQVVTQKYRNVFGIWMWRHMRGLPLLVYGNGEQVRAFTYIDDIVAPLYLAGTSPQASKEIINLGGKVPTTINQAVETLQGIMGGRIAFNCEARHEVHQAWCTTEKSERLLDYEHKIQLDPGLEHMWDWVRNNEQTEHAHPTIELYNQLPGYWT